MARLALKLAGYPWDHLTPLLTGEVVPEGICGDDWPPYGLEPNLQMLTDFCQDQYAQKLVDAPVDPAAAFADYTRFAR